MSVREFGELVVTATGAGIELSTTGPPEQTIELGELREWSRYDALGRYRPLSGARSLRPGMRTLCADEVQVATALDTVYPLASVHRQQHARGELRLVGLEAVFARQAGRYRIAAELSEVGREAARQVLCGRCVRTPAWAGAAVPADGIPCPEPCSVLLSLCREAALWEKTRPAAADPDPAIPFADFEAPGNEVREDYLRLRTEKEHDE